MEMSADLLNTLSNGQRDSESSGQNRRNPIRLFQTTSFIFFISGYFSLKPEETKPGTNISRAKMTDTNAIPSFRDGLVVTHRRDHRCREYTFFFAVSFSDTINYEIKPNQTNFSFLLLEGSREEEKQPRAAWWSPSHPLQQRNSNLKKSKYSEQKTNK